MPSTTKHIPLEVKSSDLPSVDWSRHVLSVGPRSNEDLGAIHFSRIELGILRKLLMMEVPGTDGLLAHEGSDNLKSFLQVITGMEQWMVNRGMK